MNHLVLYYVKFNDDHKNKLGVQLLAHMTVEQAWGVEDHNATVLGYEDHGGMMIPVEFTLSDIAVVGQV